MFCVVLIYPSKRACFASGGEVTLGISIPPAALLSSIAGVIIFTDARPSGVIGCRSEFGLTGSGELSITDEANGLFVPASQHTISLK
ncbi:MAG: hypothetical protein EBY36_02425 [Gammaproteobacteria bacterium]|nr:hypothetical protein [Gammaproteobacteria bacterium]